MNSSINTVRHEYLVWLAFFLAFSKYDAAIVWLVMIACGATTLLSFTYY
jgi:hypothetical protein